MRKDKMKTLFVFPLSLKPQTSNRKTRTPHSSGFQKPCIWAFSTSLREGGFSTASMGRVTSREISRKGSFATALQGGKTPCKSPVCDIHRWLFFYPKRSRPAFESVSRPPGLKPAAQKPLSGASAFTRANILYGEE